MASAARRPEADAIDRSGLIGSIRRLGNDGPPYEVLGAADPLSNGRSQMRIHLIETDEDVDYTLDDILSDPIAA